MKTLSELALNESARIASIEDSRLAAMLLELGCKPGTLVRLVRKGLFQGPMYVQVGERVIAMRRAEAAAIVIVSGDAEKAGNNTREQLPETPSTSH